MDYDIDLVYLWVDGSDPQWLAKKNAHLPEKLDIDAITEARFTDNDELKYSLRSAEKFAPWINKIFIVTDNQTPQWLNTNHPKIKVVDHTEIMPPEALPCFNSAALETRLPYIEGLSEHFLYANDDMFFADCVNKSFFFDGFGKPIIRFVRKKIKSRPGSLYERMLKNAQDLIFQKYGFVYENSTHHNIDAYSKTYYLDCIKAFEKELKPTMMSKFRNNSNIERILIKYYMFAVKYALFKIVDKPWYKRGRKYEVDSLIINHGNPASEKFKKRNPKLFCINDGKDVTDKQRRQAREFLQMLFPEKSGFEV